MYPRWPRPSDGQDGPALLPTADGRSQPPWWVPIARADHPRAIPGPGNAPLRPETASPEMRKVQSLYDSHPLIVAGSRIGTIAVRIGIGVIVVLAGVTGYILYMNQ